MNGWDRTAMTEMTFNPETEAYEYEYNPTADAYFAFADYQMTADEAAADNDWSIFNNTYRYGYAGATGNQDAVFGTAVELQKGERTIKISAGEYKISVAKDFSTVTITGTATGIDGVNVAVLKDAQIYNLKGQRLDKTQKGLNIINGRKVVIK